MSLAQPYRLTQADNGPASAQAAASRLVEHRCTASIGIMVFSHGSASEDGILKRADTAMHRATDPGRNTIRFAPD